MTNIRFLLITLLFFLFCSGKISANEGNKNVPVPLKEVVQNPVAIKNQNIPQTKPINIRGKGGDTLTLLPPNPDENIIGESALHQKVRLSLAQNDGPDKLFELKYKEEPKVTNLQIAAWQDEVETARFLLANHATVDLKSPQLQNTALHFAALSGSTTVINLLLSKGADINAKNRNRKTPLFWAIRQENEEAIIVLLDNGAKIDALDIDGISPLHDAVFYESLPVIEILLNRGSQIDTRDFREQTPLHFAAQKQNVDLGALLIKKGAEIHARDFLGNTPLHHATSFRSIAMARLLLSNGARSDVRNINKDTPLHLATSRGYSELMRIYLEAGGDPNLRDRTQCTLLHLTVSQADVTKVPSQIKTLLSFNVDPNICDEKGHSPLHYIIYRYRLYSEMAEKERDLGETEEIVKARVQKGLLAMEDLQVGITFLIGKGANPNIRDKSGLTVLDTVYEKLPGDKTLIAILEKYGALSGDVLPGKGFQNTYHETEDQVYAKIQRIIKMGGVVDSPLKESKGLTYLHLAAKYGYISVAKILVEAGVDVNVHQKIDQIISKTAAGLTPLHLAVKNGHREMAIFLLKNGAKINVKDSKGTTPLHAAAQGGHLSMVELLLDLQARIYEQDVMGQTALFIAAVKNHLEIVELLLKHGASPEIRSLTGETAYQAAKTRKLRNLLRRYMQ